MTVDMAALADRGPARDQQRQQIKSLPASSTMAALLSAEALNLLEVQFRMEDALLVLGRLEATIEDREQPQPELLREAAGHLEAGLPCCQQAVQRLAAAAATADADTGQLPLSLYISSYLDEEIKAEVEEEGADDEAPYDDDNLHADPTFDASSPLAGTRVKREEPPPPPAAKPGKRKYQRGPFPCPHCPKVFAVSGKLARHQSTHAPNIHKCTEPGCSAAFRLPRSLLKHARSHWTGDQDGDAADKRFECAECGKKYRSQGELVAHERLHTGEKPCLCPDCGKAFRSLALVKQHQKSQGPHTSMKRFRCPEPDCSEAFRLLRSLAKHTRICHRKIGDAVAKELVEKPHRCTKCEKAYRSIGELRTHMYSHTGERPFICAECGRGHTRANKLRAHMARKHGGEEAKNFLCDDCPKAFAEAASLKMHQRTQHSGERCLQCSFCSKFFTTDALLQEHLRIHTGEKPFSCETCGKKFRTMGLLKGHGRVHSGEKPYKCAQCDNVAFKWRESLLKHLNLVHWAGGDDGAVKKEARRPFACLYDAASCSKAFRSRGELLDHISQAHTGERPHSCEECGKTFASRKRLLVHVRSDTHGGARLQCPQCPKTYSNQDSLAVHLKLHNPGRCVSCRYCNKPFPTAAALANHERVHTGERPHSCAECGKSFKQLSSLLSHKRMHEPDKYVCTQCPETFRWDVAFKKHLQSHDGTEPDMPHACTFCPKRFAHRMPLVGHLRSHTGERPFACPDCGKCFAMKSALKRHARYHSGDKRHACTQCDKKYFEAETLRVHIRAAHTGERPYACSSCHMAFPSPQARRKHEQTQHLGLKRTTNTATVKKKKLFAAAATTGGSAKVKRLLELQMKTRH